MFENLKESIGEAFTDDLRKELEAKINEAVESKAEARVQSITDSKIDELNEACEEYKAQLSNEAHNAVNEKINELNEMVDKYVDKIVDEFIKEHEETFRVNEEELCAKATLEALRNACLAAGVKAQDITERMYVDNKIKENHGCSHNAEQLKVFKALVEARKEADSLLKENAKLIKMGIIAEMCEGMSKDQTEKFKELAENVEFSRDRNFVKKLDSLKDSIVEDCDDEEIDDDVNESVGSDIVHDLNESIKSKRPDTNVSNDMLNNFNARMRNLV